MSSQKVMSETCKPASVEAGTQIMDLSALARSIHAGEAYESALTVLRPCLHRRAPNCLFRLIHCTWGRLGLALESPTTVPTATAAPMIRPTLITNDRVRRCFAGAITAPAGREAAMPMPFSYGATAVPTGAGVPPFCCSCVAFGAFDWLIGRSGVGAGLRLRSRVARIGILRSRLRGRYTRRLLCACAGLLRERHRRSSKWHRNKNCKAKCDPRAATKNPCALELLRTCRKFSMSSFANPDRSSRTLRLAWPRRMRQTGVGGSC